ncbi:MAG: PDZ domain-containing protein [Planctomycetaceae bacterium]
MSLATHPFDIHGMLRRVLLTFTCTAMAIVSSVTLAQSETETLDDLEEQAFIAAAAMAQPSLVRIETVGGIEVVDNILTTTGPTTGIVVASDGWILSSTFNFIAKPASIVITTFDGRKFPARHIADDRLRMLTLLRIDAEGLIPIAVADPESFQPGRWAIALGRTYDSEAPNISVGIISALKRVWGKALQTDAKISPVNYGGPLVDLSGQALGILVPLTPDGNSVTGGIEWYDSGIGFAIPIQDALLAAERMKTGNNLSPGLLGVSFRRGGGVAETPIVDRVQFGSPAQQGGLAVNDLITHVDERPVARVADIRQQLGTRYADDQVALTIKRGEESLDIRVQLVAELLPYESGFLGVLPLRTMRDAAAEGVVIRYVFPNSVAEEAGLQRRDRIIQIQDRPINTIAELSDAIGRTMPGDAVKLTFIREKQRPQTLELKLGKVPNDLPPTDLPVHPPLVVPATEALPAETTLAKGRFTETLPGRDDSFWAYVPEDYNPQLPYGLVVWIHPTGETHEAVCLARWKSICDTRGLIMLGPKADRNTWSPEHTEFVKDAVTVIGDRYNIDPLRRVVLSYGNAGGFTQFFINKERDLFNGIVLWESPLMIPPPEHEPEHRWQWFLGCHEEHSQRAAIDQSAKALREMKYPTVLSTWTGKQDEFPPQEAVEELSRWIDSLDRL